MATKAYSIQLLAEWDKRRLTKLKEEFSKIVGESPGNILGDDWEDHIDDYMKDSEHFHEGHQRGGCYTCKMD